MRRLLFLCTSLLLGGCTTTSFAPPQLDLHNRMTAASLSKECVLTTGQGSTINEDVAGARALILNHIETYDCAMRVAANGRQAFELPAFFSLVGATTLIGLGEAGRKAAFLGQSGNSIFSAGKSYYAPQEQTTILRSAVDALTCIQSEASGVSAYEMVETAEQQRETLGITKGSSAEVTVEQQYYDLIYSRLKAVNGAAAQRLAQRGTFDAAGVAAQIETAAEDLRKAEEERDDPPQTDQGTANLIGAEKAALLTMSQKVQLDLNVLRPKLDKCVARAKA